MRILGVDPGLDGAFAWFADTDVVGAWTGPMLTVMPAVRVGKRRQLDELELVRFIKAIHPEHAFVESVGPMPKQGVVSTFSFGCGWGQIRGVLAALGVAYTLVRPQAWQKVMLAGQPKGSEYAVASRLWPATEFRATSRCRTPHAGLLDAALLAEYGRRQVVGGGTDENARGPV